MERTLERLATARKALRSLQTLALDENVSDIVRDAAIQRFEYTFEAVWKAAKMYLSVIEGLEIGSPKGVARACFQVGILSEAEVRLSLEMIDDRNLTVHTYNEGLARQIFSKLAGYADLMDRWLEEMEERLAREPRA